MKKEIQEKSQCCGFVAGHRIDCNVFRIIETNNTFITSVTEKLVKKDLDELKENSDLLKNIQPNLLSPNRE